MAPSDPPATPPPAAGPGYATWIFWLDGLGGLLVGLGVLAVSGWLAPWYGLPRALVIALGVVNVTYGLAGLTVARRPVKPPWMIRAMAAANLAWGGISAGLLVALAGSARWPGLTAIALEGAYVAALGALEWRLARPAPRDG